MLALGALVGLLVAECGRYSPRPGALPIVTALSAAREHAPPLRLGVDVDQPAENGGRAADGAPDERASEDGAAVALDAGAAADEAPPAAQEILPPEDPPVQLAPDSINVLGSHIISHHREAIMDYISGACSTPYVLDALNRASGQQIEVKGVTFNVTGPLQPEKFFRCSELRLSHGRSARARVVYADVAVEYTNRLLLAVDLLRLDSNALRVVQLRAGAMRVLFWGNLDGLARLRLTLQADDTALLRVAHVAVTDASNLRIRLDKCGVVGMPRFGRALRFITSQMPLQPLERVANEAMQRCFRAYSRGWDVGGGVKRR